eukprot:2754121-Rhodomonas_salina.1
MIASKTRTRSVPVSPAEPSHLCSLRPRLRLRFRRGVGKSRSQADSDSARLDVALDSTCQAAPPACGRRASRADPSLTRRLGRRRSPSLSRLGSLVLP